MESFIKLLCALFIISIFACMQSSIAAIVDSDEEIANIDMNVYTVDYIGPEDNPDEIVINGEHYDPKTYCDISAGDKVRFVVNLPDDCVDAKIYNYRTKKTCDIWCTT